MITSKPRPRAPTHNVTPVSAGDSMTAPDISKLTFAPETGAAGVGYASFTFRVKDDGGTDNGGLDTSQSANTITIDAGKANSAVALSSSAALSGFGTAPRMTAVISPNPSSLNLPYTPGGNVTFSVDGTVIGTPNVSQGTPPATTSQAVITLPKLLPGTHTVAATYGGDTNFKQSPAATLTQTITCGRTITGKQISLTLGAGSWCVTAATVAKSVTIGSGAHVFISASTVGTNITATTGGIFALCASNVIGSVSVSKATGFVVVGGPGDDRCNTNGLRSSVSLAGNTSGVEIGGNTIGGSLVVNGNSGAGPFADDSRPEIEANTIQGALSCKSNVPAPTADGKVNKVTGTNTCL